MQVDSLPEFQITLNAKLEDIPEGPSCHLCGFPTEKTLLEDHVMTGGSMRVRALQVAGYRCSRGDGAVAYSHEALAESFTRGAAIMQQGGDAVTANILLKSAQKERGIITDQLLSRPRNILRATP